MPDVGNWKYDSNADSTTGRTDVFGLSDGENDVTRDAGLISDGGMTGGTIGNVVWDDQNRDGVQDATERGLRVPGGMTVDLYATGDDLQIGGTDDVFVATTKTNKFGVYEFTGVSPGTYYLQFTLPDGDYAFTPFSVGDWKSDSNVDPGTGFSDVFSVFSGDVDLTRDAGVLGLRYIGDRVWIDADADGQMDDGERGLRIPGGMTVNLFDAGSDQQVGGGDDVQAGTTQTNKWGQYLFEDLVAGYYYLQFVLPDGFEFTQQQAGVVDATKDSDADQTTGLTPVFDLVANTTDLTRDAGLIDLSAAVRIAATPPADSGTTAPVSITEGSTVYRREEEARAASSLDIHSDATPPPQVVTFEDDDGALAALDELLTLGSGF